MQGVIETSADDTTRANDERLPSPLQNRHACSVTHHGGRYVEEEFSVEQWVNGEEDRIVGTLNVWGYKTSYRLIPDISLLQERSCPGPCQKEMS